ncbi:MAG: hypothetical protein R3176_04010 [Woeseiaceae bacterium]|nr:hypothetical protein [Woeseiaceae bacterium]
MFRDFKTAILEFAAELRDALLWPGIRLLDLVEAFVPALLDRYAIAPDAPAAILVASGIAWLIVALAVLLALRLLGHLARQTAAMLRVIGYRTTLAAGNLKTRVVCLVRELLFWRRDSSLTETGRIEFDDLEFAILRYAVARGPGFAVSAPELAESFSLRPSQVQRGIDGLTRNRMLDHALGSTDGFDNYSLTDAGAAFIAMWDRQQSGTGLPQRHQPA